MAKIKSKSKNLAKDKFLVTRSQGPLGGLTSSLWPFGPALGLLDFILRALLALRPCEIEIKAKATTGIKRKGKSERYCDE